MDIITTHISTLVFIAAVVLPLFLASAAALFFLTAAFVRLPDIRAQKAIVNLGRAGGRKRPSAYMGEIAARLAPHVTVEEYKRRRLERALLAAGMDVTPEMYTAVNLVKGGGFLIPAVLSLPFLPPLSAGFAIFAVAVYIGSSGDADAKAQKKKEEVDYELPRFVATVGESLKSTRDIRGMLESYVRYGGTTALTAEITTTMADMGTGNYEAALTRLEGRVGSSMLSEVVRGLIGVIRGDDGRAYFRMLAHDLKQLELARLKKTAMKRPAKIRRYSFVLLVAFMAVMMGVIGYHALSSALQMF